MTKKIKRYIERERLRQIGREREERKIYITYNYHCDTMRNKCPLNAE